MPSSQGVKRPRQSRAAADRRRERGEPPSREVVRAFVLRLIGDPALADDLTQETLARAHKSAAEFRGEASRETWLCSIALNLVRDHFRASARSLETTSDPSELEDARSEEDLEQALLQAEMSACIGEFLTQLPRPQYDVLALHDKAGLTHREIAGLLGISTGNSRVLLHRGRAALRLILEENCLLSFGDSIPCERRAT